MTIAPERELTGIRWSEMARCPRAAALRGLGAEPAEASAKARRYRARGQLFGAYAWQQFAARYGATDVERERVILWPLNRENGGHADVYVRSEKLLIEVVSSTSPDSILPAKIKQVRGYLHFDPEATKAAVYVINPSDLDREDLIPVVLHSGHIKEIARDIAAVQTALDGGPLPDCPCQSSMECRHSFCSFTEQAWEGWTPPPTEQIAADKELVSLCARWNTLSRDERQLRGQADALHGSRKDVEAELGARSITPGLPYEVGETFRLKRTVVAGRETFSRARAAAAGIWTEADDDRFGPFVKIGSPSERWQVEQLDKTGVPYDDDFGEEPPF